MTLRWGYSRSRHRWDAGPYGDGSEEQGHEEKWVIQDCRPQSSYHLPEHGYDLRRWGKVLAHKKTVKELKLLAQCLENGEQ